MERQLIDLTALKEKIAKPDYTLYNGDMRAAWIEECINNAPVVTVENNAPAVHGHWVFGEYDVLGAPVWCGVCGKLYAKLCNPKKWIDYPFHKYCGRCGALMDGDENE